MKKRNLKILIFLIAFAISSLIFSDWEHFKSGLFGKHPTEIGVNK